MAGDLRRRFILSSPSANFGVLLFDLFASGADHVVELLECVVKTVAGDGARRADTAPSRTCHAAPQLGHAEQSLYVDGRQGLRQVLLVGDDQQRHAGRLPGPGDACQLHAHFFHSLQVGAVDDKHHAVSGAGVRAPEWSNLVLSADVPDHEAYTLNNTHTS